MHGLHDIPGVNEYVLAHSGENMNTYSYMFIKHNVVATVQVVDWIATTGV